MQKIKTLFLEQSYNDCKQYLAENIKNHRYESWDFIILTASNEEQAKNYRLQLQYRQERRVIDPTPQYIVIPDYNGERIGSGGATLCVLATLKKDMGISFEGKKILLIHSGGDSKRIPQYSVCGKLFSPIPRVLANNCGTTLFDELLATASIIPSRMKDGIMVMSGDVMLLFNPLQIDFKNGGAAAITIKKSADIGKNHGVFLTGDNSQLLEFLHKKSVNELKQKGAVNVNGDVDIDTGVVLLDSSIMNKLVSIVESNGEVDSNKFSQYINSKVRLSFYGDFLYPFAKNATKESYLEQSAEGEMCQELLECRKAFWDMLSGITLQVLSVSPSEFLHFGTTAEVLELFSQNIAEYRFLGWQKNVLSNSDKTNCAIYQSSENNCIVGDDCYLENCIITDSTIGEKSIVSFAQLQDDIIPEKVVISGLRLNNGKYVVRIYGIADDPKKSIASNSFMGANVAEVLEKYGYGSSVLKGDGSLWSAELFPICDSMKDAVKKALLVHKAFVLQQKSAVEQWSKLSRISFMQCSKIADVEWLIDWQKNIERKILITKANKILESKKTLEEFVSLFEDNNIQDYYEELLSSVNDNDFSARIRLNYFVSKMASHEAKLYEDKAFAEIVKWCSTTEVWEDRKIVTNDISNVELPARVNWGGGWTDTPPYCLENGGTVLNCAIKICGDYPIKATVRKIKERKIILQSKEDKVQIEIKSRDEILNCNNPFDPFALQKASLVATGIVRQEDDKDLGNLFDTIQCGFVLSTEVVNIPRGSGLGTSSILAAACVKALTEFCGMDSCTDRIYQIVLMMEQLMSTGGGWQDQVGGLEKGIKMITTAAGKQNIEVEKLIIPNKAVKELKERMVLIYTGQRRLARTLLRDIVGNYLAGNKQSIIALKKIEQLASSMSRELKRGDIDAFGHLLNEHWEYSKMLDGGSTNTCIDYIFEACDDLLEGKMICGAGGGGFLQVIMKKGVTSGQLQIRLTEVFGDAGVVVWDSQLDI